MVAAALAEGNTVGEIATATFRAESSVRWHQSRGAKSPYVATRRSAQDRLAEVSGAVRFAIAVYDPLAAGDGKYQQTHQDRSE